MKVYCRVLPRVSIPLLFLFGWSLFAHSLDENGPFRIGNTTTAPGEVRSITLPIPEKDGMGTFIPVTVINGVHKGKALALVAGVHGYEYPPILALYRMKELIDPEILSGTLILVHIANLPAFQKRIIYYNPHDWKNLNRVFPGHPQGSLSERIAYILTEEVIKKCDYLIDLHCGDGNEALIPYSYWMASGNEEIDRISRDMVLAFGIKHIIIDRFRPKDPAHSVYLGNTAILHSKPAITTESGYLGKTDEESVSRNIRGVLSVMRLFRMIEGELGFVSQPVWIDKYEVVYSKANGLFYPLTEMGYWVKKGEKVGCITDYFGEIIDELYAPFSGVILYIIHTPPITKGEPLFEVGRIQEE